MDVSPALSRSPCEDCTSTRDATLSCGGKVSYYLLYVLIGISSNLAGHSDPSILVLVSEYLATKRCYVLHKKGKTRMLTLRQILGVCKIDYIVVQSITRGYRCAEMQMTKMCKLIKT
jgi:hypothetical protein